MQMLRFQAEYMAPPFFDPSPERMGHVDIDDLPLPEALRKEIEAWNSVYQATFHEDYPPLSGFKTEFEVEAHNITGRALAKKIQEALGVKVEFVPVR